MYLEVHHPEILQFLEAKKNHGDENARARDLFYAVWVSDLFMRRVKEGKKWSLFCPDKCRNLSETYGEEYERLYLEYENDPSNISSQVDAKTIWKEILVSQMETGTPYICYKDACNRKSNQQNLGTIKSSNLCTEIIEYSDTNEYACCTLASISLKDFIKEFDFTTVKNVKIYSKSSCKFCKYSKQYLDSFNIKYDEILLDDDTKSKDFFDKLNENKSENDKIKTVPQIYINSERIGGFDNLYNFFKPSFDFKELAKITKVVTNNLDKVIDINFYPVIETKISNVKHRPLGIGVQGLADVFALFKYSFDSEEAKNLNKQIFATIYYASCQKSMEISKERNDQMLKLKPLINNIPEYYDSNYTFNTTKSRPKSNSLVKLYHKLKPLKKELERKSHLGSYSSFDGSPISLGKFQFDLWGVEPLNEAGNLKLNWESLRNDILKHGIRNSLLLAPMPTASTSQILSNNECIEPFTSNIYSRATLAGQFVVINKYLQDDLIRINLWNNDLKDEIILKNGSIKLIEKIPKVIREIYKISWDLSMKSLIDLAADRGVYVCQSQSLNLWIENPSLAKLTSMHFYSWKKGLKTGIYYLRRRATSKAQTFSIEPKKEEECLMCSA